jgi:LCP family protein required for cell wall assembly
MSYLPTPKSRKTKPQRPSPDQPGPRVPRAPRPPTALSLRLGVSDSLLVVLTLGYLMVLGAGIYLAYTLTRNMAASSAAGGANSFSPSSVAQGSPLPPGSTPEPTADLSGPSFKPWNGVDRVTVLVMGLDFRANQPSEGPPRTDTMMLISMDPVGLTAGVLSIPRDLWVDIPGFGFDKINTAYFDAESYRLPGGGPALAMRTVEELLGIPIDYYAVIDFNTFTYFIDNIGGIDVNVPERELKIQTIYKGGSYSYILRQGMNHLDGPQALAYARDRDTPGGDMDRARRQQQVIFAVRDKVLQLNMLPHLILTAPDFYKSFAQGLKTNITLDQAISLAWTAKGIPRENIKTGIISTAQLQSITQINGLDVIVPNLDKVRALRDQVFLSSGGAGPSASAPSDPAQAAVQEAAKIQILNGSGISGAAAATKSYLLKHGFSDANIVVGDAQGYYPVSRVIDLTGAPYTVAYLVKLMQVDPSNNLSQINFQSPVDVQVILGGNWRVPSN